MANVHQEMLVLSDMNSSSDICWIAAKSMMLYRDTHEVIRRSFHRIHRYLLCYCLRGEV
jgi:predicted nucleotidyltransferase